MEPETPPPGPLDSKTIKGVIGMLLAVSVSQGWLMLDQEQIEAVANAALVIIPVLIAYFRLFKNQGQLDLGVFKKSG